MTIRVRRATIADAKTIVDFNFAIAKETERLDLDRKRLLRGVKALLKDASKGYYILGEIEGQIVGQLMITYEWSDWRAATFWWGFKVSMLCRSFEAPGFSPDFFIM